MNTKFLFGDQVELVDPESFGFHPETKFYIKSSQHGRYHLLACRNGIKDVIWFDEKCVKEFKPLWQK